MTTSRKRVRMPPSKPREPTRTELQLAEEQARDKVRDQRARRWAARYSMLNAHACTGLSCTSPVHPRDRETRDRVLMVLGLIPDPQAQWARGAGYTTSKRRLRIGEER